MHWNGSNYQASLTDTTRSGNNKLVGFGSGTPAQFQTLRAEVFIENGGDTTCSDYSSYGGQTFSNMIYYDSSGNTISFTPSGTSFSENNPNGCSLSGLLFAV